MSKRRIAIVGAGVVGLNTALEVTKTFPDAEISLIAEYFNEDTTSDGAAGLFEISSSFKGPSFEVVREWLRDSFNFYSSLLSHPEAGVRKINGFYIGVDNPALGQNRYLEGILPAFRPANQDEMKELGSYKYATFMSTLVTSCRCFLPWALERIREAGVSVKKQRVTSFLDLENDYDIVFNCTGIGAKALCNDPDVTPIRGQVIKVRAPFVSKFFMNCENGTYIIPQMQSGLVTLGGTHDFGHWSRATNEHNTHSIFDRCREIMPTLESATVEWHWVGLRPHRYKVRVEAQMFGKLMVIHNYGHGGYGVTTAPGSSKYAVNLAARTLNSTEPVKEINSILKNLPGASDEENQ